MPTKKNKSADETSENLKHLANEYGDIPCRQAMLLERLSLASVRIFHLAEKLSAEEGAASARIVALCDEHDEALAALVALLRPS